MIFRWTAPLALLLAGRLREHRAAVLQPGGQPAVAAASAPAAGQAVRLRRLTSKLAPVAMPERFARPQLVVRQKGAPDSAQVDILEQHRWASSFENELRDALASGIAARLGAIDVTRAPAPRGQPVMRIAVQLRQFDATRAAAWTPASAGRCGAPTRRPAVRCRLSLSEPVGGGIDALAAGARRVSSQLAEAIAGSVEAVQAGRATSRGLSRPLRTDCDRPQRDEIALLSVLHSGRVYGTMSSRKYHQKWPPT